MLQTKLRHRLVHFNSIKVQLKHSDEADIAVTGSFQFHKGTIKTQRSL